MLSRRAFLISAAASTALSPLSRAQAAPRPRPKADRADDPQTLLRLERRNIEVNGKSASVLGIRQPDGTSGIRTEVGKRFRVRVENGIGEPSLIHWHGLTPPWQHSPARRSRRAEAPTTISRCASAAPSGHSHQGLQEQLLLAAPLIIHDQRDRPDQQEVIVMLTDFSFTPPDQIFAALKKDSGMAAMPAAAPAAMSDKDMKAMRQPRAMTPGTTMGGAAKPDLNDVKYDAFLANDRTLGDPEVVKVEPGGRVLLRVINSSSMSAYHLDLGALDGELIAVDGFPIAPVTGRRFPIAVAQRLDVRLTIPRPPAAYPVLAVLEGENRQTGIILRAGNASVAHVPDTSATASPALTLDLESRLRAAKPLAPRKADRVHTLNLTGAMAGYIWSINNVPWTKDVPPLPIAKGERVELVFVNQTPMPHPMHLHGHEFQVLEIDGKRFPGAVRDTVLVPPGRRVVVAFDANNPGLWALHCHLLYHLDAGMFTTLRYV